MAISDKYYNNAQNNNNNNTNSIYDIDERLTEELSSSLNSIFEKDEEKLRRLKDVKTLIDCYKTTREYKQQAVVAEERGILSTILNKIIQELLTQIEPYYKGSIIKNIEIQTQVKKDHQNTVVEVNSKIDFEALLKPYVEFTIEVNGTESYLVKFTFQVDTSAYMTNLTFTGNNNNDADKGKSIRIEKLGITLELSLLRIEFSDLIRSSSNISLDKTMKLGSKSFEINDLSLYEKHTDINDEESTVVVCPKCNNTINSLGLKYCTNCSLNL